MEPTTWSLWVRGRIRTTIELADGGDEALATLEPRAGGFRRSYALRAEGRDGRRWEVTFPDGRIEVRTDGVLHAQVFDDVLTAGGRTFAWRAPWDWSRRARATSDDGTRVLDIVPGEGRDDPWAIIAFSKDLPSPFAVVLAACFVLLRADALGRDMSGGGGGGGP